MTTGLHRQAVLDYTGELTHDHAQVSIGRPYWITQVSSPMTTGLYRQAGFDHTDEPNSDPQVCMDRIIKVLTHDQQATLDSLIGIKKLI